MRCHGVGHRFPSAVLLFLGACATSSATGPAAPPPPATNAVAAPASPPPAPAAVARIDGQPVAASELDAHQAATGLERSQALADLIDLRLLRAAASRQGIDVATGVLDAEARAAAEFALATKLGLAVSPASHVLVVDHAWVKDNRAKKAQAAQRAAIERLRGLVAAGDTIPTGWEKLGVAGSAWHVGDHEDYPYEVLPPDARDLPAGSLSPVLPGDGGLHLFKIIEHKQVRPAADAVSAVVRPYLREGRTIELLAGGGR
jgi:hypothetical protein